MDWKPFLLGSPEVAQPQILLLPNPPALGLSSQALPLVRGYALDLGFCWYTWVCRRFPAGHGPAGSQQVAPRLSLYYVSGSLYSFCPPNNPQEGVMLFPFHRATLRSSDIIRITGLMELGFDSRSS